jgi:hypothetical protein
VIARAAGAALLLLLSSVLATPSVEARPARRSSRPPRAEPPPIAPAAIVDIGPAYLALAAGWRVTAPGSTAAATAAATATSTSASTATSTSASSATSASPPASAFAPIILRGPDDATMILTRMPAGNLPAWARETRDAHVDELVAGFTAVDGATVVRRTVGTDGPSSVPVLELTLTRAARPVAIRVILFRTLTVVAAATADRDTPALRAALARAAAGLHPDR